MGSMAIPRLYTPEEVAVRVGHLSAYTIRRLVAEGRVAVVRGARNKVLMTEENIAAMLEFLTAARPPEREAGNEDNVFGMSARSWSRHSKDA